MKHELVEIFRHPAIRSIFGLTAEPDLEVKHSYVGVFERAAGDGFEHGKDVAKAFKISGFSFLIGSSRALIRLFQKLSHSFPVLRRELYLKEIASTFRSQRYLQTG